MACWEYINSMLISWYRISFGRQKCLTPEKTWLWHIQKRPPEVFYKETVLKNFAKFTGKHLCQSLFFNKVAGLRPATLLKKRLWHRWFSVNFATFSRTHFLQNTSGGCFCLFYAVLLCWCSLDDVHGVFFVILMRLEKATL